MTRQTILRTLTIFCLLMGLTAMHAMAQTPTDTPENNAKIAFNDGNTAYKAGNYDEAIGHFDRGISLDPNNPRNFYGKALALGKKGDNTACIEMLKQAREVATNNNITRVATAAQKALGRRYITMAGTALNNNDLSEALAHLTSSGEYMEADARTHLYYANIYNKQGKFAESLDHAQQGLALERRGRAQKAGFYYLMGEAQMALGNTAEAKTAYQNALFGQYKKLAEYALADLR